jgi:hypothetical protein
VFSEIFYFVIQRHIYGCQGKNIQIFADDTSLAVNAPYIRSWLDLLSKTPRVVPFLTKNDPFVMALKKVYYLQMFLDNYYFHGFLYCMVNGAFCSNLCEALLTADYCVGYLRSFIFSKIANLSWNIQISFVTASFLSVWQLFNFYLCRCRNIVSFMC